MFTTLQGLADAFTDRFETARTGKTILDKDVEGHTERFVRAKLDFCEALAVDTDICQRIRDCIAFYEEVAKRLRIMAKDPPLQDPGMQETDFDDLAEQCEQRARRYRIASVLGEAPPLPEMTAVEHDVATIIKVKDKAFMGRIPSRPRPQPPPRKEDGDEVSRTPQNVLRGVSMGLLTQQPRPAGEREAMLPPQPTGDDMVPLEGSAECRLGPGLRQSSKVPKGNILTPKNGLFTCMHVEDDSKMAAILPPDATISSRPSSIAAQVDAASLLVPGSRLDRFMDPDTDLADAETRMVSRQEDPPAPASRRLSSSQVSAFEAFSPVCTCTGPPGRTFSVEEVGVPSRFV